MTIRSVLDSIADFMTRVWHWIHSIETGTIALIIGALLVFIIISHLRKQREKQGPDRFRE